MYCLQYYFICGIFTGLVITNPPQNATVCAGDDVNITCGYTYSTPLFPIWVIGEQSYTRREITLSSEYDSPSVNNSEDTLLTVYSVSILNNQTTFQCHFQLLTTSSYGTLTVMGELFSYLSDY